jgi:hypothetical protein
MSDPSPTEQPPGSPGRFSDGWPWLLLALGLVVVVLLRVPLVANAKSHLDSDLAVDGLTLREALEGRWRWHYPGTPAVGTPSLALMLPVGALMGATPRALGVAGVFIYGLFVLATFVLALRVFGRGVAAWSLVPLVFASTGTIWLSGRITGGHLLAAAWFAAALTLLYELLSRGGGLRALALGVWCGLGLWNDTMFALAMFVLVAMGIAAWFRAGPRLRGVTMGLVVIGGMCLGLTPAFIGRRADPYDAYNETFEPIREPRVLYEHLKILAADCLPRLIIGHRLPHFEAEPGGIWLDGQALPGKGGMTSLAGAVFLLGFGILVVGLVGLAVRDDPAGEEGPSGKTPGRADAPGIARWAVRWGLLMSMAVVPAAFVVNRNIFNSDNYRYLVFLLVPWAIAFGRQLNSLSAKGIAGAVGAGVIAAGFAAAYTLDTVAWYRGLGWLDDRGRVVATSQDDPVFGWFDKHPDVIDVLGGYWDVYRLAFLSGGRIKGIPTRIFPDRFPEWSAHLPDGRPTHVILRSNRHDLVTRRGLQNSDGVLLFRAIHGDIWYWPPSPRR